MDENKNFIDDLIKHQNKIEINIKKIEYKNKTFLLLIDNDGFNKINKADIIIYNHKTNQYRVFKFSYKIDNEIEFKYDNLSIKIKKNI